MKEKDKLTVKDSLEIVWKLAVGLSVACYLIGFIVVNIHFNRFGYYSVSLVSSQYLTAGVWAIVPIILAVFYLAFALSQNQAKPQSQAELSTQTRRQSILLPLIIGMIPVASLVLMWFSEDIPRLPIVVRWIIISAAGLYTSVATVAFFLWLSPLESLSKKQISLTVTSAIFVCLLIYVYLMSFSRSLFGDIAGTWGGGKPRLVRIVVKSEERENLMAVGVNFPQGDSVSEPMELLVATDKEYILVTGRGDRSLSIRSDVIQAVSYESR